MARKPRYKGWVFTDKVAIYTHFGKPLYGYVFGLAEAPLKYAIKQGLKLVVKTGEGTATFESAKDWIKGAQRIKMFSKFSTPFYLYTKSILPAQRQRFERKKEELKQAQNLNRISHQQSQQLLLSIFS